MNTNTIQRSAASRTLVDPLTLAMNKAMSLLVQGINSADKMLRNRPGRLNAETAALLRLAETYESTQPSYAADLRAAALAVGRSETEVR